LDATRGSWTTRIVLEALSLGLIKAFSWAFQRTERVGLFSTPKLASVARLLRRVT
jgi:hypothetical protein